MMRLAIATGVAGGLIGAAIAVGVMAWEPWDGRESAISEPDSAQRVLTGGEAAARAEHYISTTVEERIRESGGDLSKLSSSCHAEDFNSHTNNWIVECIFKVRNSDGSVNLRFQVDDATGEVAELDLTTPR